MDSDWLRSELAAGRSIGSIARSVGKHPATVSYWLRRHGLESQHAGRHRPRGGLSREELEPLVAAGLSSEEIPAEVDRSVGTVRHWLREHGLVTRRSARRAAARGSDGDKVVLHCSQHGQTLHALRPDGGARCLRCRSEFVVAHRRRMKAVLVEEAGGRCLLCGYSRCIGALHFHHLDPRAKRF